MHLNLPTEINDFVKGLVSQGRFDSEESAVVEGVRLLMTREKLRAEIQTGVEQLDNGQWYRSGCFWPFEVYRKICRGHQVEGEQKEQTQRQGDRV